MRLTVKLADGFPPQADCKRNAIGTFALIENGPAPLGVLELPETVLPIGKDCQLIIQANYVPINYSFSIIIQYKTLAGVENILYAGAETQVAPVSLVCHLPDGRFAEVHLEHISSSRVGRG
jgi:hypothetical protein